jgi:hypothetical protein
MNAIKMDFKDVGLEHVSESKLIQDSIQEWGFCDP